MAQNNLGVYWFFNSIHNSCSIIIRFIKNANELKHFTIMLDILTWDSDTGSQWYLTMQIGTPVLRSGAVCPEVKVRI